MSRVKIIRVSTVPISLKVILRDQLRFINQYFELIAVSSSGSELDYIEMEEGIRTIELEMSRKITPIKDFISLLRMIYILYKEKPQIVHTHTPKAGIIGMVAAWITRVPHRLHTVAGLPLMEAKGFKKKVLICVEKITYACATKIYPNSFGLKQYILDHHFTKENKLKVIGSGSSNGVDTEFFCKKNKNILISANIIKKKYSLEEKVVFCFVGRVVKHKGIDELMIAFDMLNRNYSNVHLFILGEREEDLDPISPKSHAIIKRNPNISYVGFKNDIRPYLACSDVFVLPTYREGFPNVVLQACSMELPCIVTNINGCNEIITHGWNGLIIEPKDPSGLYEAMSAFLNDTSLIRVLGSRSRNDVVKKFDRRHFLNLLLEEYYEVLNGEKGL